MRSANSLGVSASLVLALVVLGCGERRSAPVDTAVGSPTAATAGGDVTKAIPTHPRVADITGDPDKFIGMTVTVEADVDEVLSPYAFELDEDSPLAGGIDNDLIVAWPKSLNLAPLDNRWLHNKVRVTGMVNRLTIVELQKELDRDLTPQLKAKVKDKPILVARSVERVR
jgi:hypothetical protein